MYEELVKRLRTAQTLAEFVAEETEKMPNTIFGESADAIEDLDDRLNLYRQGKITRPATDNNKLPKRAKCYFFEDEQDAFGNVGVCYGTREKEHCKCGGDFTKCDMPSDNERVRNAYKFTDYDNKEQVGKSERRSKWNLDGSCQRCGKHSLQTYGNFCCYCGADMRVEDVPVSDVPLNGVDLYGKTDFLFCSSQRLPVPARD